MLPVLGQQAFQGAHPARRPPFMAAWYSAIMARSAVMTSCSVITSGDSAGRPASGSGPANASEDRHPAVASSAGSAAAEAASTRRLGRMSGTRASYRIGIAFTTERRPVLSA